jgi:hypothetical protein
MNKNNLKKLAEEYNPPEALKNRVRNNVTSNLSFLKFIGDVFDLYVGKAGQVFTGMMDSFEDKATTPKQYASSDIKELPSSESIKPQNSHVA